MTILDPVIHKYIPAVQSYREKLASLQGIWDSLSLLTHLSGGNLSLSGTRQGFETLATDLVTSLGAEIMRKAGLGLKAKARVAIDIMVRNLYERTADIGFLSADDCIVRYLRRRAEAEARGDDPEAPGGRARGQAEDDRLLQLRFDEYVRKYSVYENIILLSPEGRVLVQLDRESPVTHSSDPLIGETLRTTSGYVETFRRTDLVPGPDPALIYSFRVCDGAATLGVLCLSFRFRDETDGIFGKLLAHQDWTVLTLLDRDFRVIATSDPWQIPLGAPLEPGFDEGGRLVRFGGLEYLAVTARTPGYQGYTGPGWYGHALVPVAHAFTNGAAGSLTRVNAEIISNVRENPAVFPDALRSIPRQAESIQRELDCAVWNGNVRLGREDRAGNGFSKVLLWEIGNTGAKTKDIFERSITDLHDTVVSSLLEDCRFLASLAVDIMDRNLYERANDCRWWALNGVLGSFLAGPREDRAEVTAVLRYINGLYTVYSNLVLFDSHRNVVAVSDATQEGLIGTTLADEWVERTLRLPDSAGHCVSRFEPSALYGGEHTLIYSAVVRSDAGTVLGGIGIVFDSTPQLRAMLQDALPRSPSGEIVEGCIGIFASRDARVISATSRYSPGDALELDSCFFTPPPEGLNDIVALDGMYYAVGSRSASGYREYAGIGAVGLVLFPLGAILAGRQPSRETKHPRRLRWGDSARRVEVATFRVADQWLGIRVQHVIQSLDPGKLETLAGGHGWVAGCTMFQGEPIAVVDLAALLQKTPAGTGGRNIIVVRSEQHARTFGLLVEELAEIPEIAEELITPVPSIVGRAGRRLVDAVARPEGMDNPLLCLLDVERLAQLEASSPAGEAPPPQFCRSAAG